MASNRRPIAAERLCPACEAVVERPRATWCSARCRKLVSRRGGPALMAALLGAWTRQWRHLRRHGAAGPEAEALAAKLERRAKRLQRL